ncbi:hypothetical protein [Candidatus Finniella inopinata]|uniref:Uncharacterized protein n=1 Tax=Candidatus Finniella inopinata TaxID=1696036 RepID=A0A4Q7DGK8_9PROT|nr:hypothetical protein [Candidatus Finniella inopinata]RZI45802.1 hypothetical protein EQU50_05035 [Candidatus Finniella inopinata]
MKWLVKVSVALVLWCIGCGTSFISAVEVSAGGVDDLTGKLIGNLTRLHGGSALNTPSGLTNNAASLIAGLIQVQQSSPATLEKLFNNSTLHDQFGFEHKPEFASWAAFCRLHNLKELTNSQAVGELVALLFETKEELIRVLMQKGEDLTSDQPYFTIAILLGDAAEKIVRGCWGIDEKTPAEQGLAQRILDGYKKSVEDKKSFGHPLQNTNKHSKFFLLKAKATLLFWNRYIKVSLPLITWMPSAKPFSNKWA